MYLNTDIIYDNLKESIQTKMYGTSNEELSLERPEFLLGNEKKLSAKHIYVVKADRLPLRPVIEAGVVIVCVGDSIHTPYFKERCCVLQTKDDENLFNVFNLIQCIYNKYDAWDRQLNEILNGNSSIKEMVESSHPIFENPIIVIDSNFHYIAFSGFREQLGDMFQESTSHPDANDNIQLQALGQFLKFREPAMHEKEPLLINILESSTLDINLFDDNEYIGCLTIDYQIRPQRKSDIALAKHLAKIITQATKKNSTIVSNGKNTIRKILHDLLDGIPIDSSKHRLLESASLNKEYICIKMKFKNITEQVPIGYICNLIESKFSKSISFEYDSSVVCFIGTDSIEYKDGKLIDSLVKAFSDLTDVISINLGISDSFSNLIKAKLFYEQTCAALENGSIIHPDNQYYSFQDYALIEMVINSLGELPLELYYSNGLRRLVEHDSISQVSYLDTLRVYLEQNMSITKTSSILYIHRSTLLERLTRIERELDTDLNDSNERLRLQILLKALELHNMIQKNSYK